VIADKGYSTNKIRLYLRSRRIAHTIPERSDQLATRARRGWRRCGFDRDTYRRRNVVERCFNQLKRFRGIATRYEKLAAHYRTVVTIASLILWLNQDPQNRPYGSRAAPPAKALHAGAASAPPGGPALPRAVSATVPQGPAAVWKTPSGSYAARTACRRSQAAGVNERRARCGPAVRSASAT
jgi:transposase